MNSPMSVGTDWARSIAAFLGVEEDDSSMGAECLSDAVMDWAHGGGEIEGDGNGVA